MQSIDSMKLYDITVLENTDLSTIGRISISCYGSKTKTSLRAWQSILISLGRLDILIQRKSSMTLLPTLRAILTALAIFPLYINLKPSSRLQYIRTTWAKQFCRVQKKKYTKVPLKILFQEACLSMALIQSSLCGGRLKITSSQNVLDILESLEDNVSIVIASMMQHDAGRAKLDQLYKHGTSMKRSRGLRIFN